MKKRFGIEDIFRPRPASLEKDAPVLPESESEEELERLLSQPENRFLVEVPQNQEMLDAAESAHDALMFARKRIDERLRSTLEIRKATHGHVEEIKTDPETVLRVFNEIHRNAQTIGEGADGRVVIDTQEAYALNPEVCYKFALEEKVKRGRNSMIEEIEVQSAFYEAAQELAGTPIGVPEPYYEIDIGNTRMIVMEKLHARSIDDILRGQGTLPEGFDVDAFCDALKAFIDEMHARNLYHRDLHYGNIMITQDGSDLPAEERPMGYVIDFGLSGYGYESMDPYRKEVAGQTFTFDDDYGRIESVRHDLLGFQNRNQR